jgi:GTPase SAR1 family protein
VPDNINTFEEVYQFLADINMQGEKWNALKLVILGHGEVGKTTLLHAIQSYSSSNLDSWFTRV